VKWALPTVFLCFLLDYGIQIFAKELTPKLVNWLGSWFRAIETEACNFLDCKNWSRNCKMFIILSCGSEVFIKNEDCRFYLDGMHLFSKLLLSYIPFFFVYSLSGWHQKSFAMNVLMKSNFSGLLIASCLWQPNSFYGHFYVSKI